MALLGRVGHRLFDLPTAVAMSAGPPIQRVAYDQDGDPIRVTVTVYRADRNRFVIYDGNVPRSAMGQP